jgi:hypothetical protein
LVSSNPNPFEPVLAVYKDEHYSIQIIRKRELVRKQLYTSTDTLQI